MIELQQLITEDLNWMGMPHWLCIGNWIVGTIMLLAKLSVGINYYQFVEINDRIRKFNTTEGQMATDKTFKWFSRVFWTCANVRFAWIVSCFVGVYWLVAILDIINAATIWKAKNVYLEQEKLFKVKVYSAGQVGNMLEDIIIRIKQGEVIDIDEEINGGHKEEI